MTDQTTSGHREQGERQNAVRRDTDVYSAATVLDLLREQHRLYGQLERAAARQRSLITSDESAGLLDVLKQRKAIAERLSELAVRLAPVRQCWDTIKVHLDDGQRSEAESLIEGTSDTLRRVMEGDARDARMLSARKEMIAGELRATTVTRRALDAYKASPVAASHRLNEDS